MTNVVVLNASYEPLRIVSVRRAIILLLQHKAACNHRKANRTPRQAGMVQACMPRRPNYVAFTLLGTLGRHETWQKYAYAHP